MKIAKHKRSVLSRQAVLLAWRVLATGIAAVAIAFAVWATITKKAAPFGRQVGLASVYSFALAALLAAAGLIRWSPSAVSSPTVYPKRRTWRIISVSACSPTDVRIHATVGPSTSAPPYVERDHDPQLANRIRSARTLGGFIVIVGGSSTGKSRSLLNAVQRELGDWHLLLPESPMSVLDAESAHDLQPRTLVWLDDTPIEKYITASDAGLSGDIIRNILKDQSPVIFVDSIWPSRYQALTSQPEEPGLGSSPSDPSRGARDALALAGEPIRIGESFSVAERERTEVLSRTDDRLVAALADTQFGVTQSLAGAPSLVRRYRDAESSSPYAYALINAAVDTRSIGNFAPLTLDYLQAASLGYLSDRLRAAIPVGPLRQSASWFMDALEYATDVAPLPGHVASLLPIPGDVAGTVGYSVADYLLQYVQSHRHSVPVPLSTWDALLQFPPNAPDLRRVAGAAESRLLFHYAEHLIKTADNIDAEAGIERSSLPFWLTNHGRIDELRELANRGDISARRHLANWLAKNNCVDELRELSDGGDTNADRPLAIWLADRNQVDELERRAASGNTYAKARLADLPSRREDASKSNADRLYDRGQVDELRILSSQGDRYATARLAGWLADNGEIDELRLLADNGSQYASRRLAGWLLKNGQIEELLSRRDVNDNGISKQIFAWLASHGRVDELRRRADAGDVNAQARLAGWLAQAGDIRELRARAAKGDISAKGRLVHWLAEHDDVAELKRYADEGYSVALERLADRLVRTGNIDGLRQRSAAGDSRANRRLVRWLAENGHIDELLREAVAGNGEAARCLLELAAKSRIDRAEQLLAHGLTPEGRIAG